MFVHRNGDPEIPLGDYLGDLTNEITAAMKHPQAKGVFVVILGPKTYTLKMRTPDDWELWLTKAKGLSMTTLAKAVVNPGNMIKMVNAFCGFDAPIVLQVPQTQFRANKKKQIHTRQFDKSFQVVSDKRVVIRRCGEIVNDTCIWLL